MGPRKFQRWLEYESHFKARELYQSQHALWSQLQGSFVGDEEAFDVAAFILNDQLHPRPKGVAGDFPNLADKPIDYSQGPYIDGKSEQLHKYGPFPAIIEDLRKKNLSVSY